MTEQRVTPYLLYEDGEAMLAWLERAFSFTVTDRSTGGAGGLHAEMRIHADGSRIFVGQPTDRDFRNPLTAGATTLVYVIVDDVEAHYERAKAAGATILEEPRDLPFGHRRYTCADPAGHQWSFAQVRTADADRS